MLIFITLPIFRWKYLSWKKGVNSGTVSFLPIAMIIAVNLTLRNITASEMPHVNRYNYTDYAVAIAE